MPFFTGIGQPINAVAGAPVPGATGGGAGILRVEPDQLDGAIAVFRDALATVESEVRWARQQLMAVPPASDQVSSDAADAFNRIGFMNANSALTAWEGAVQQLRSVIDQLEQAKQTVVRTDTGNVANFQVP